MNNHSSTENSLSIHNPSLNDSRGDKMRNYGSNLDSKNAEADDFGYVEFSGSGGRTCPTCNGTGRIAKHQEEELVALIPYNDRRLKPSRTKCYVILAVTMCLITAALVLFFLLPRTVCIKQEKVTKQNVSIDLNMSSTIIVLTARFNITNLNFIAVELSSIAVVAEFDQITVGTAKLSNTPLAVEARSSDYQVDVNVTTTFDADQNLEYVADLCTSKKRKVHDIVLKLQTTLTVSFLQHSEQNSISSYNYVDCSNSKEWRKTE